jgi:hypothetical protein
LRRLCSLLGFRRHDVVGVTTDGRGRGRRQASEARTSIPDGLGQERGWASIVRQDAKWQELPGREICVSAWIDSDCLG